MKVDFWPGMAAKRASLPTITLASIRKANFDFVETATFVVCVNKFLHTRSLAAFIFQFSIFNSRSFACLARAKIKIVYSAKMGAKWTNSASTIHALRKPEPFDEENLFVCFSKRKALAKLFSLSDSFRLALHFLKSLCRLGLQFSWYMYVTEKWDKVNFCIHLTFSRLTTDIPQ